MATDWLSQIPEFGKAARAVMARMSAEAFYVWCLAGANTTADTPTIDIEQLAAIGEGRKGLSARSIRRAIADELIPLGLVKKDGRSLALSYHVL